MAAKHSLWHILGLTDFLYQTTKRKIHDERGMLKIGQRKMLMGYYCLLTAAQSLMYF